MKINIEIYSEALTLARIKKQTVDLEEKTIGGEGDYFITLEQLQWILKGGGISR